MNGRTAKKVRAVANRRFMTMVGQIGQLPFRQRLWFAWRIVKGSK